MIDGARCRVPEWWNKPTKKNDTTARHVQTHYSRTFVARGFSVRGAKVFDKNYRWTPNHNHSYFFMLNGVLDTRPFETEEEALTAMGEAFELLTFP